MHWLTHKVRVWFYGRLLRKMIRAKEQDGWDYQDICCVLLNIGGELDVLTPSVIDRLNSPTK